MKIKNNTDLIQSYIMTTAKYEFSAYEKRIMYRIVEVLQANTNKLSLKYDYSMQKDLFGKTEFTMPIKCFLKDEKDQNYDAVKTALISLRQKGFEYEDSKKWGFYGIIEYPEIHKYESFVKFTITPLLMNAFMNFSKGFRKYELQTAMSFESVYSMRFYELFSGKSQPITYRIDELKKMFGIENKYQGRPSNFIKKVIEPAQKELKKHSPYSFKFDLVKTGRKITMVTFKPYYIPENRDSDLEEKDLNKNVSPRWSMSKEQINYLKEMFGFTDQGIKNNIDLLKEGINNENFKDWCLDINKMIRQYDIENPTGFFIKALKKHLNK